MTKPGEAPAALQAPNRQQAYRTIFRRDGIEIVPTSPAGASWRLGVSVTGYGYEGAVQPLRPEEPQAEKERVEYRRGSMTEWYVNQPGGLEQGFELQAPQPRRAGPLIVAMAVRGDLEVSASNDGAAFARRSGGTLVRYAGLKAWDADRRPLRCRLDAVGRNVRLVVEVQAARFPVVVDPTFVHEARLSGRGDPLDQADAHFGNSVAIDGDTVVVGTPLEDTPLTDAGSAYVFVRSGTTWNSQQRLLAPDGAPGDEFGHAVAIDGNTIVVGARYDDLSGAVGSAYVFVRSGTTWNEQQKLSASDGGVSDVFGSAVAIYADTVVVGAPTASLQGTQIGAAYVFIRSGTTWTEQQKLVAPDGDTLDFFGGSVALYGDVALVGASSADNLPLLNTGAAYVFLRAAGTWTQQQKLLASDGETNGRFGVSVSLSGDTAVVGALHDLPGAIDAGAAYVFVRSGTTWSEQQKLTASDAAAEDAFGDSVSISGDSLVVGSYQDDSPGAVNAGSAYVFVRSGTTWSEEQKLSAFGGTTFAYFGTSVSLSGDTVVVGTPFDEAFGAMNAGAAYVFLRTGSSWAPQQRLEGLDEATGDAFGFAVAVSADTVVVGAPQDNLTPGVDAGSAYVFVRSGTTWTEQQKLVAGDAAAGDNFGASVAVAGDTAVVGAPSRDTTAGVDAGAAYVFARAAGHWLQSVRLVASDGSAGDSFGQSVSIYGDTIVAGANGDDLPGAADAGSAYVFVRPGTSWIEQQKLSALDAAAFDHFGSSVSAFEETVVIGAPLDDNAAGVDAGAAYAFVRSGTIWNEQQKLLVADGATLDRLGSSVSLFEDTTILGAPAHDAPGGVDAGAAYVFVRSGATWTQQQELLASDGAPGDQFGSSVSVFTDAAAVGAPLDDGAAGTDAGAAYTFARLGANWAERQKLLPPAGAQGDHFGVSASLYGATLLIGAHLDDDQAALDAGSAHVFRGPEADVGVTKTDGQAAAVPGQSLTYTIVVSNIGPAAVNGVAVTDALPAALLGATWSCVASAGSSCTPNGSGNINDAVNLAVGGTATYLVTGTVSASATGTISNTVTVTPPGGVTDPNPDNNSATDTESLTPETDLAMTKTDSADPVSPGDPLGYLLTITNNGPSDATVVTVVDTLPAAVTFVSSSPGPPECNLVGVTVTCDLGTLGAGGNTTVTINVTVNAGASGILVNTATVSGNETDPDPRNNSASAATAVGRRDGEMAHGTDAFYDLAAQPGPATDEDVFRIEQKPYSSYEVVVDATSGDIGAGNGPFLERIAADGTTVLQGSSAVGTGPSRSLRWSNTTSTEVEGEAIRVRSAGCGTDCGPDDVYRIRAYETTYAVPRFNNAGTQITVLVLQNPTNDPIAGQIYFRISSGTLVAVEPFGLNPKATLVLNTATVPGANGVSGAITVAHNGRYGELSGKTVALEPATGFSFDSPLVFRPR